GGREALEKINIANFDLVFTDLAMPEMDGWETARAIRQRRPGLPVVLVTGYGATAQPPAGEVDLVAGIIGKPFDFDQVTGTIARVVGQGISDQSRKPKSPLVPPSQVSLLPSSILR